VSGSSPGGTEESIPLCWRQRLPPRHLRLVDGLSAEFAVCSSSSEWSLLDTVMGFSGANESGMPYVPQVRVLWRGYPRCELALERPLDLQIAKSAQRWTLA